MRVLHAQKIHGISGSERYFINVFPHLIERGVEIEFLIYYTTEEETREFAAIMQKMGVKLHFVKINGLNSWLAPLKSLKIIKEGNFDLVNSHLIHSDLFLAVAKMISTGRKFKLVSTKHGYDESHIARFGLFYDQYRKNLYYLVARFAEGRIDRSFTVSHGLSKLYFGLKITPYYPKVIWHGLQKEIPSESEGATADAPYILLLGRTLEFKGHQYLLEAFASFRDQFSELRVRIVGDGDYLQNLKDQSVRLGIQNYVDFTGFVTDVEAQVKDCLFLVALSKGEGFGLILLEAFQFGKPVIAFDTAAFNEIVQHEVNGLVVPYADVPKLESACVKMLQDSNLREELGNNGRRHLEEYFKIETCAQNTFDFYNQVLSSDPARQTVIAFTISLHGGGAEKITYLTSKQLASRFKTVIVLLEPKVQFIPDGDIEIWRLRGFNSKKGILKLLQIPLQAYYLQQFARKFNAFSIVSFLNRPNYINILNQIFYGRQETFISERTYTALEFSGSSWSNVVSRWLIRTLYPRASKILVNSKANRKSLLRDFRLPEEKTVFFPNILSKKELKSSAESNGHPYRISFIGRLDKNKNAALLIRALGHASFDYRLKIIGEGPERKNLEVLAKETGNSELVEFVGFSDNLEPHYQNTEVLVLCSNHEGYPNVLLEAIFRGIEVIASDCYSGPREILTEQPYHSYTNGISWEKHSLGYLFKPNDEKALTEVLSLAATERRKIEDKARVDYLTELHTGSNILQILWP